MMDAPIYDSSLYQEIIDMQALTLKMSMPWLSIAERANKMLQTLNYGAHTEAINVYSSLDDLYRIPGILDSSGLMRLDFEDGPANEIISPVNVTTREETEPVVNYNTNAEDINKANQEYLDYLRTRTDEVASGILHTDFEDGMDNDVTLLVKSFARKNKSATYNWLDELYSKNLNNSTVVEGILRTLAMITEKGDENILLPIVVAGLRSEVSVEQEAALMVIEEWRTKECMEAIRSVHRYASDIIEDYAMMVLGELEEELA